jgi:2-dehydropantoate 2-reductase
MKISILGGAGAMGAMYGARLAIAGEDVTLIDVNRTAVDHINQHGVRLEEKTGAQHIVKVRASDTPVDAGTQDYVLVFTKCYHTEGAVRAAQPMIGPGTTVVSLQNGWGNAPRIQAIVGDGKVFAGVTYNSGMLKGPGHTLQGGVGVTHIGEIAGGVSPRVSRLAGALRAGGFEVNEAAAVLNEIWRKLALNVCTLPTASVLSWEARKLVEHAPMKDLMAALLREVVAVAQAKGIALDYDERWAAITGLLEKIAPNIKGSMVVDVDNKRRTEIDVMCGAIIEGGRAAGIPTPHNDTLLWLIKSMEARF